MKSESFISFSSPNPIRKKDSKIKKTKNPNIKKENFSDVNVSIVIIHYIIFTKNTDILITYE